MKRSNQGGKKSCCAIVIVIVAIVVAIVVVFDVVIDVIVVVIVVVIGVDVVVVLVNVDVDNERLNYSSAFKWNEKEKFFLSCGRRSCLI